LDTSVIHPAPPLGSPPAATGPDLEQLAIAAYGALRSHPAMLTMLGAPLHDWFAAGGEIRQAMRDVTEAVLAAMPQPPAARAVIDALHDGCAATIAGLETDRAAARAENGRLTAVIDTARPHTPPAGLAPLLYAAYIGRVRAAMPDGIAFADWDQLDDGDPMAAIARDAFTAVAQLALEPVQADYDQAAELISLRAQLADAQERVTLMEGMRDMWREASHQREAIARELLAHIESGTDAIVIPVTLAGYRAALDAKPGSAEIASWEPLTAAAE
jgi:hypothetical protein